MSRPAVTIAIPFHDEEQHLESAVRSVLRQTHEDFELLLVDDGSADASLSIARSFEDPRIVVTSDGARRGLPARLNEIARRARGDLVARMDADDMIHPARLAKELAYLEAHPSCPVVGTWVGLFDSRGVVLGVTEAGSQPASTNLALVRGILAHATIVARRSWLLENPYDESLSRAEDRDLWVRTASRTVFGVVPEPLYAVRLDTDDPRFIDKYVQSQTQNRAIAWKHGPRTIGWVGTARFVMAARAKTAVMRIAHATGLSSLIVRRRGRAPTVEEHSLIAEALASGRQSP